MPSSVNASGRRKVRCPKCTALLTEPQTQIYECPICSTLLLAKGNLGSRLSENRAHKGARDIQQIVEGGPKLEKARFIDEFNSEQVQQGIDNVESIYNVGFQGRSRTFQPDLSYESAEAVSNIPSEGHFQLDLDKQSLSGTRFSKHTTESVNDSVPKSTDLSLESSPDIPGHRRSPHLGDTSLKGESEHQFSELDSASRTESEADLDSPTWSSDNANIKELPEAPSMVSSFEASSPIDRSHQHVRAIVSIPSSGSGGNDGAHRLEEESEPETRQQSYARFEDRGAEEEIWHEERHQSLSPDEGTAEKVLRVEKKLDFDSRSRSTEVLVGTSSAKSEGCMPKDQNSWELCNDKGIVRSRNSSSDCTSNGLAGSAGITNPQISLVDSRFKETCTNDAKLPRNDGDRKEVSNIGKFRLFDLSVFGIYNEETYSELMRGKAAHYSKLSESGSDGDGLQSTADGEKRLHSSGVADSSYSHELDCGGGSMDENVAEVQKSSSVSELPVVGTVSSHVETGSYRGMSLEAPQQDSEVRSSVVGNVSSHVETGSYREMRLEAPQQDSDLRSSISVGQEVGDGGIIDLEDAGLLPVTSTDIDVIANARYGDILEVKDLGVEVVSSIDISFGDWQSQQVVKPPHKASEQNHVDSDPVHEKRVLNMATGEGTDSSWDDDDEATFSSTSKEDAKFKGTAVMEKVAQTFTGTRSSGRSQAKSLPEKPAFPLRTTAMQKFLKREDQEILAQAQSPQKADSELYEAPYMEHYTPPPDKNVQEAYQTLPPMSEQNVNDVPNVEEDKPLMIAVTKAPEDTEKKLVEFLNEDPLGAHSSFPLKVDNGGVLLHPLSRNENDVQTVLTEDVHSRKESDSARSPQRDATVDEMDRTDLKMAALDSEKVDYWLANKVGTASGKPASLRWKGKGGSSTQSLSSTEDEGAYGMDSEAGSGPDRGSTKKQGIGLTGGRTFPDKEVKLGLGQQPRGQNQPNARLSPRSWLGNIDVDRQKHGSGELVGSRRTARSRPSSERLPTFEQADRLRMEGKISNLDTSGRSGLDRQEQVPAFQGQALNLNSSMLDQGLSYSYNGTADYNSDHSSRSQEVPPHPQYNERYMFSMYGLPPATSGRGYPFQVPPHGSVPPAPLQEQGGLTHPAHHCTSPSCSLCIQQQYYMQQPQMLQNVMLHPCAACASQSSAAAYLPIHHEMHGHHIHASTYSNLSLRQHDSGVLPAQSRGQNRSSIHQSHPVPAERRLKLHPPLPGKGAPPYVLCRACNQLLQVPGYLPPFSGPIQRLHCGACGKSSKFSVPLLAASPSANRDFWPTNTGSAMNASDMQKFLARDKRRTDTVSVHSSEQIISSVGLSTSGQNLYGMARHTSGQGYQHDGVENRSFLQPNGSGISSSQTESVRPHHPRPMTGGMPGQAQYRSQGRHGEGEHLHTSTGLYNEDYASSSPSSASGSSPGRHSQMGRQIQQVEPHRTGRPGFGERNLSADLPALSTMHEQGRPPFDAPSFSDGFFQRGANEGRSRFSSKSLQGSLHDSFIESPRNEHFERFQAISKAGSLHNQPADVEFSDRSSSRSRTEQIRKMPAAPGSPLIEHFTQAAQDVGRTTQHRHMLQNSGNGSRSAPWSPASGSPLFDPYTQDTSADFNERSRDRECPRMPNQDATKGPKSLAGLLKRSIKDLGKGGQGGSNRRKVVVNGHVIPEAAVRKAEEQAGAIHSGTYWYDYQAGFWGVKGGPCLGILMPFIEELNFPLARDCAGGTTGILVNGRELHEKDLEVLAKRGLPRIPGRAYILDISGALFDDVSGQPLRGLGKLAPSIEKKGRGFGMSQFTARP